MADFPQVRNSVTVSLKAKQQVAEYEPVEMMVSYTLALSDDASLTEFQASQQVLYDTLIAELRRQLKDAVSQLRNGKAEQAAAERVADEKPRQPIAQQVSTNPSGQAADREPVVIQPVVIPSKAPLPWTRENWWPKKTDARIGQWWICKVLDYEKGEFTSQGGKKYNALVLTVENGKFPKEVKIFHDAPAYPGEGKPWRDFFETGGKRDVREKGVYVVMGHTGKLYKDGLEAVALSFTSKPDGAIELPGLEAA